MSRNKDERRLTNFEDSVDAFIRGLKGHIKKNKEGLITSANNGIGMIRAIALSVGAVEYTNGTSAEG